MRDTFDGMSQEQIVVANLWKTKSFDLQPPDISSCNLNKLIDELVNAATISHRFEPKFLDYLYALVRSEILSWPQFLRGITSFKGFKKFDNTRNLSRIIRDIIPQIQMTSIVHNEAIVDIINVLQEVFLWLIDATEALLIEENVYTNEEEIFLEPLSTALKMTLDPFCGRLIALHDTANSEILPRLQELADFIDEKIGSSEIAISISHQLNSSFKRNFTVDVYKDPDNSLALFNIKNPSIRILTSIFCCYRILLSPEEVADSYNIFSHILGLSFEEILFDMFHTTLLIKSEESGDLPFLPKQQRIDFRWHVASFYYMKMPKIWKILILKHNHPRNAIPTVIEKSLTELSMTMDIIDMVWKDCSLRSFLIQLTDENIIESHVAEHFIEKRYRQMHQNPELDKLTKFEYMNGDIDQNSSDIGILKNSMVSVKALKEKGKILDEKVIMGLHSMLDLETYFQFDSIIACLCFEGNMTAYSHILATFNTKAQTFEGNVANRLQSFDYSFLLLSRISLKWPSVPLILLVNGGTTPTNAQTDGIYYQWALRYLKRVRKSKNAQDDTQKEEEVSDELREMKEDIDVVNKKERKEHYGMDISKEEVEENLENPIALLNSSEQNEVNERDKSPIKIEENLYDDVLPFPKLSKEVAAGFLCKLRDKEPFWDRNDINIDVIYLIHAIPSIGELLLEEFGCKRVDRDYLHESLVNILIGLQEMSCLFVCLIQWLDCQPDTQARRILSSSILEVLEKSANDTTTKWGYILSMLRQIIVEMSEKEPVYPEVTCTAFSNARSFCPKITRAELPDVVKLKSVWYYMQLQGWASPHALRLIEHTNCAGEYKIWSHIYVNKTIKIGCGDMMKKGVDMIYCFLMLDQFNSLIRIHESLVEFWFNDEAEQSYDGRFDPSSVMPIIRLMANVLLLSAWSLEQQYAKIRENGPPTKKIAFDDQIEAPDIDDPDSPTKWAYLIEKMIEVTINRFLKSLRKGLLTPVVCAIFHLMKEISASPESEAKRLLLQRIPRKLIFELAYIDPSSVSYEMFNTFCELQSDNKEQIIEKVRFLGALRRRNVI